MRLAVRAEKLLRESQCSFRKGCGCVDQVFSLRILAEKAREFKTALFLAFVDLRKAYDSVNRDVLWIILRERYHLPDKLVKVTRALHQGTSGAVRAYGRVSKEFTITTGARQGDVLAPTLLTSSSMLWSLLTWPVTPSMASRCYTTWTMCWWGVVER